jgi:hypothetical protein
MTVDEFLSEVNNKGGPAALTAIAEFERQLGSQLPEDYREFLIRCNGGHVGGRLWYVGPTPNGARADAGVHHVGGFRKETYFSLERHRESYEGRIPRDLLWIMDDPFGNAICLGIAGDYRGRVYFWDHEMEPDADEWNGAVETAGNLQLLANSFTEFVAGLHRPENDGSDA